MSSLSSSYILEVYNSRNTILELLKHEEYDVSDYSNFSINEINTMYSNNQLDMLVERERDGSKLYVKHMLNNNNKQIRKENLDELVEDLFVIENVLTNKEKDTIIIIAEDEPNDTITAKMKYLYDHDGVFVVIHNIKRLQFNILKHSLVPDISILNDSELKELMVEKNFDRLSSLPEISRFDPQALAVGLRPKQVCKLIRKSITAVDSTYYRVCV